MNPRIGPRANLRRLMLAVLGATLLTAVVIGFSGINANAATVSSDSNQCQFTVGDSTGVTSTLSGGKCLVKFTAVQSTTWTAPQGVTAIDLLIVGGGGGGGGQNWAGGGGAGGVVSGTSLPVVAGSNYAVTVGGGGDGGSSSSSDSGNPGSNGQNSSFSSWIALGGGGGAGYGWNKSYTASGSSGGSGGGAAEDNAATNGGLSIQTAYSGLITYGNRGGAALGSGWRAGGGGGGAGGPGQDVDYQYDAGNGGSGIAISIAGTVFRVAGGGGGATDTNDGGGGSGGSVNGVQLGGNGGTNSAGQSAPIANSGSGGGGAQIGAGGSGSSGIVVLAYSPPDISVVTAGDGVRVSSDLLIQPVLQLRNSADQNLSLSGVQVTVSTNSGSLSGNSAISISTGRVTFTNLRFTSGTPGTTATLTFSAPGFINATQTIKIQTLATEITINSSASSNGNFVNGVWLADSASASVINTSTLQSELQAKDVIIEASSPTSSTYPASGNVTVASTASQSLSSDRTLTLKATRNIFVNSGAGISATGSKLNVVLWADSDGQNSGATGLPGSSATWSLQTNGGHVAIGGGSSSTSWNGLTVPSGYSSGMSSSTAQWWGVELGVNQASLDRKIISTNGGNLRIFGETKASTYSSQLFGIAWEGGEISTVSGTVELNGKTTGSPSSASNQNFGVGIGANYNSAGDIPILNTTSGASMTGTTSDDTADHFGIYVRGATLNAGSGVLTLTTNKRIKFDQGNTISSRVNAIATSHIYVSGANSFTGSSDGKALTLTSTSGWVEVTGSLNASAGMDISCLAGGFSNSGSGTLSVSGALSAQCDEISVSATLSSSGAMSLVSAGSAKNVTINSNLTTTSLGSDILLKSKANVVIDTANVTLQTAGKSSGTGGRIIMWSDSDASGQGYISIDPNSTLNTIGGATTTYTGGGDIHLAGGLDDGSTTVSPNAISGDGLPDGWAIGSATGTMGIWYGYGALSGDINTIQSGGGQIRMFAKSTTTADAMAFQWTTKLDSGNGQIEFRVDSASWGLQLNRGGENDTYAMKSAFTSRSNLSPAIGMYVRSTGDSNYVALLGSWADAGTDNLLIQSLGSGSIELKGDAPNGATAIGLTSTSVLSQTGKITIDGGTGGIHFGMIRSSQAQGQVQIGDCSVATCGNSLVTNSTADVDIVSNRVTSFGVLGTTVSTSGALDIVPASGGSKAFTDFQNKTAGLTLATKLGGLQIGRPGDTTSGMTLAKNWTISGPISVHAGDVILSTDVQLTTTDEGTAPIRFYTAGRIYSGGGVDLTTNGSDVVYWTAIDKVAGTKKPSSNIYIETGTITTNGGKIWLAGGLDDGGADAQITSSRGKWSSVVANDGLPDGYAEGVDNGGWDQMGVLINSGTILNSGGGDVFIAGASAPTTSSLTYAAHIGLFPGAKIDSGSGRIAMWGKALGSAGTRGIALNNFDNGASTLITSNAASSDAITIYSDSSASTTTARGISNRNYGSLSSSRVYQGAQIAATASGGGVTLTGIGSSANVSDSHGIELDFTDIFAIDGPITLNGDSTSVNDGSVGVAFGWVDNMSSTVRLGGWAAGAAGGTNGNLISTPGGLTADFASSDSDVTINTDSIWIRESSYGMLGVYPVTSGNFSILPTNLSSGLIAPVDSFKTTQNGTDWSFNKLQFLATPESVTIGRPTTTTATRMLANLEANGSISIYGSSIDIQGNLESKSGRGPVLVKSTSTIKLAASKTYQTKGTDLIFWGGSTGGNGYIEVGNNVCLNTNASCDPNVALSTGSIYLGGGVAGTTYPTGPIVDSGYRGVRLGTSTSGIKVLSGGGDIEIRGQSNSNGLEIWNGVTIKATSGAILLDGGNTGAGAQGVRFAGASGTTTVTSAKASGTAIEIVGKDASASDNYAVYIAEDVSTISATGGGDVIIRTDSSPSTKNSSIYLGTSAVSASQGGRVQIKASGSLELIDTDVTTDGQVNNQGGEISIWADSNADNQGRIYIQEPSCISTSINCASTPNTGGSKIVIGGGPADADNSFFPGEGAVANSTTSRGVQFGANHAATGVRIISAGGDISIASEQVGTLGNDYYGQLWYGGTVVHSGYGAIEITNTASGSTASTSNYGLYIHDSSYPVTVTSNKSSGTAISVTSSTNSTGNYSTPILLYSATTNAPVTIQAPNGGDIVMSGTAAGTGANTYSFDISRADILASTGDIQLSGNRGFWLNRLGVGGPTNFGSLSTGAAEGDVSLLGNRWTENTGHITNFRTAGKVTIAPLDGQSYLAATTFPSATVNFTGVSELTFGNSTNTQSQTTTNSISGVAGPITFRTGNYTGTGAITTTVGPVNIYASGTVGLNNNISSGTGGILVKANGKITIDSTGTSVATARELTTTSGPITLWTTASDAGVDIDDFVLIQSNASSSAGADITIGGGVADPINPDKPAGNSTTSSGDGDAIAIGASDQENVVRIFSGEGDIEIRGEATQASSKASGIEISAGAKIIGASVALTGKAAGTSAANNTVSGIFHYSDSVGAQTLIEATKSFTSSSTAISIDSELVSGTYGTMLMNATGSRSQQIKIATTGENADILISGSTDGGLYGVSMSGCLISTKNGKTVIDANGKMVLLSRSGANRSFDYEPIPDSLGGDLEIYSSTIDSQSSGYLNISTAGKLSLLPPAGQGFADALTFPLSSSNIDVGGLVVGNTTNTSNLTLGSVVRSSGDVEFFGGAQTASFNITTTNGGNIEFHPTSTFSKGTNSLVASGSILIGSADSPSGTLTLGSTTLAADQEVKIYSSENTTIGAAISAGSGAVVSASGTITQTAQITSGGNVLLQADGMALNNSVSAPSGMVSIAPVTTNRTVTLGSEVTNTLSLSTTELNRISTPLLRVSTAGNIAVTASLNFTNKVSTLALRAGGNVTGSAGVTVTVANLGIDAGGTISFPGNQAASVIALSASSVTFNQSADYSVATVDGIDPEFGYGVKFAIANVPVSGTLDAFMAVTFNPPPTITIRDKFNNVLESNNTTSGDFTVTPSLNVASTTSGTLALSGTNPVISGATHTFSSMAVSGGTGTATITFTADRSGTPLTESSAFDDGSTLTVQNTSTFTTNIYNVQAGEPSSISLTNTSLTAPAGKTGFGFTATLKDSGGNVITSGTHSTANVTVSVAGEGGVIIAGGSGTAVNGEVDFSSLAVGGTAGTNYTLTFSVTYTDTQGQTQTVTQTESVTLTPGDAIALSVDSASQSAANLSTLSAINVALVDDFGNIVLNRSDTITATISGSSASLSGTTSKTYVAGATSEATATFSDLVLRGTADSYTLTFSSSDSGISAATSVVTLTHGPATQLVITNEAAGAKSRIALTAQPSLELRDASDNVVSTGELSASTVTVSSNATVAGTTTLTLQNGAGSFSDLSLSGTAGAKTLTFTVTSPAGNSSLTTSQSISLLAGVATKLEVTAQPSDVVAGESQGSSVVVEAQDADSNPALVTSDTSVSVKLTSSFDQSVLETGTSVVIASGTSTASFSSLSFTKAGTQKLLFEATGLTLKYSDSFDISPAEAHHLAWATNTPPNAVNDEVFSPAPALRVFDQYENPVIESSDATSITASVILGAGDVDSISGETVAAASDSNFVTFDSLKLKAKIGTYKLRFTATKSGAAIDGTYLDSNEITLGHGAAVGLAASPASMSVANRSTLSDISVRVIDSYGNTVADSGASIAVSVGTLTLSGSNIVFANSGVAVFGGLSLAGTAGSHSLEFTSSSLNSVSVPITLTHGIATSVNLSSPAALKNNSAVADGTLTAEILDIDGNLVTSGSQSTQDVTLTSDGGVLGGTTTQAAVNGLATFDGVSLTGTIGTYSLTATISQPSSLSDSKSVTLTVGDAYKLMITQEASGARSRQAITTSPIVRVADISGNLAPSDGLEVVASVSGATLSGTTTQPTTSSVATFVNDLVLTGTVGDKTITYTASGAGYSSVLSVSQTIALEHGVATQLSIDQSASGVRSGADFTTQPRVEILDADGNRVTTTSESTTAVSVSVDGNGFANGDADLTGTLSVDAVAGLVTFTDLRLTGVSGSYTLNFASSSPALAASSAATLISGSSASFRFIQQPTQVVAGQNFSPAVTAEVIDAQGNRVLDATDSVNVVWVKSGTDYSTSSGLSVSNGLVQLSNITQNKAGEFKLRLEAAGLTAAESESFTVKHDVAHSLAWVVQPSGAYSSDAVVSPAPKVQVLDQYLNPVTSGPVTTVSISVSSANSQDLILINETANTSTDEFVTFNGFSMKGRIGNYDLRLTANNGTADFATLDTDSAIQIVPGIPTALAITTPAEGARAGMSFTQQPVVEIRDSANNRVSNSSLSITASIDSETLTGGNSVAAVNGVATFLDLGLEGTATDGLVLTFDTTFGGNQIAAIQNIDLVAGNGVKLKVVQDSSDVQTRVAFDPAPSVEILDAFDNRVLSDSVSEVKVSLRRAGIERAPEGVAAVAVEGLVTFPSLSYQIDPHPGYSLLFRLVSNSATVASADFTILPGPVAAVEIVTQPSTLEADSTNTRTGNALKVQPKVRLVDQDGNIVTTLSTGVVNAVISTGVEGTLVNPTASIVQGFAQFSGLSILGRVAQPGVAAEDYKLTFTYSGFDSVESQVLNLRHALPSKVVLVTPASGGQVGQGFSTFPVVKVLDAYDNLAYSESTQPTISVLGFIEGSGASVEVSQGVRQLNQGVATLSPSISGLVSNTYRLEYTVQGNSSITKAVQSGIALTPGVAHHLNLVTQPLSVVDGEQSKTGEILKQQPVVEMLDSQGNRLTTWTGTVEAQIANTNLNRAVGRDYLTGMTVSAVDGVATFAELALIGEPGFEYSLKFVPTQDSNLGHAQASNTLSVTHADPYAITIETQPVAGNKTGSSLTQSPVVAVRDFDGNIASSLNSGNVVASISTGNGTLPENSVISVVNGIATFSNLKMVAPMLEDQKLTFTLEGAVNSDSEAVSSPESDSLLVIPADPHALSISSLPSTSSVAGELLPEQPVVEVVDQYGNRTPVFSGTVIATVSAPGDLVDENDVVLASIGVVVADGLASFEDLRIKGSSLSTYSLTFAAEGLVSATSAPISLSATAPDSLEIDIQPLGGITGAALGTQPVIRVLDRYGNLVESDNSTRVSATVASGPARVGGEAAALEGETTVTATGGIATFTDLALTGLVNSDYRLSFTDGTRSVVSEAIQVTSASASTLTWVVEPVGFQTGEVLTTMPQLQILDFDGNPADTSATVVATVSGGSGSIAAGDTATSDSSGLIQFSDLTVVAPPGEEQTLKFTATTADGSFHIETPTPLVFRHTTPSQMVMTTTYSQLSEAGSSLPVQPVFEIQDRYGNKAIYDNSSIVTASIGNGVGGNVSGGASATAVEGVVTFENLSVTGSPGEAYTLEFASSNGEGFTLSPADVLRVYKTSSLAVAYPPITYSPGLNVAPTSAVTDSTENVIVYSSTTSTICEIDASTGEITVLGAGDCVVRSSVAGGTYYKAVELDQTIAISKANQAPLSLVTNARTQGAYKVLSYGTVLTLATSGGSTALPVRYWVSGPDCRLIGTSVVLGDERALTPGNSNCDVYAVMPGNENYNSVSSATLEAYVVPKAQDPISIGNSTTVSVGSVSLFIVGGSGIGAVTYEPVGGTAVLPDGSSACSIVGNVLTATTNGTCEVSATKAASKNYSAALSAAKTFTFNKQVQQITFSSIIPTNPRSGQTYSVSASASSGLPVTYSITNSGTGLTPNCTLSTTTPGLVQFGTAGICEITASQAGNEMFAATSAKQSFVIGRQNQTISFEPISDKIFGAPLFKANVSASSGLPVTITVDQTSAAVCSIDGTNISLLQAGTCLITATQNGDANFEAASPVSRVFAIAADKAGAPVLTSVAVGNQWFTASYRAPSYLGGSAIAGFRMEITNSSGDKYVNNACSAITLTCTISGIPNDVAYTARVAAITGAGIGNFSSPSIELTPSLAEMSVQSLAASASDGSLDLTWELPAGVDGSFQSYDVYVWVKGTQVPTTPTTTVTNKEDKSVSVAVGDISNDPIVSDVAAASYQAPKLNIVQPLLLTNQRIIFGQIDHQRVGLFSLASLETPAPDTDTVGYEIKVVTISDTNSSEAVFNTANGVKLGLSAPSAPRELTLDTLDPSKIVVTWAPPVSDGGYPVESYLVKVNDDITICPTVLVSMPATCTITALTPGTSYVVSVQAGNSPLGFGEAALATYSTPTPPPPSSNSGENSGPVNPTPLPDSSSKPTPKPTPKPSVKPSPSSKPGTTSTTKPSQSPDVAPSESKDPEPDTSESSSPTVSPAPSTTDSPNPSATALPVQPEVEARSQVSLMPIFGLAGFVIIGLLVFLLYRRRQQTNN